jgi:hypothetical protein
MAPVSSSVDARNGLEIQCEIILPSDLKLKNNEV